MSLDNLARRIIVSSEASRLSRYSAFPSVIGKCRVATCNAAVSVGVSAAELSVKTAIFILNTFHFYNTSILTQTGQIPAEKSRNRTEDAAQNKVGTGLAPGFVSDQRQQLDVISRKRRIAAENAGPDKKRKLSILDDSKQKGSGQIDDQRCDRKIRAKFSLDKCSQVIANKCPDCCTDARNYHNLPPNAQPSAAKSRPPHKLASQYVTPIKTAPCCKNATVSNENVEKVVNAPIMPVPNPVVSQDGHLARLITKKVMNDSKKHPHRLAINVPAAQKFCDSTYRIAPPKNAKHATLIFSANFTKITP